MDGLEFPKKYGAQRMLTYAPLPPMLGTPAAGEDADGSVIGTGVDLDYEIDAQDWTARTVTVPVGWRPAEWAERPIRFVDGKDVGETVTCLRTPVGRYPVPVRLSEIGGVVVREVNGELRREFGSVERVVSMVVDPFPWHEVEAFAAALQEHGLRLLPAQPPNGQPSYDFEEMRKAAQNRSNREMDVLEEAALAQDNRTPSVVDGRLEPRQGGFDQGECPVVGVIKTQREIYLHARGMQILYDLEPGQRTPLFRIGGSDVAGGGSVRLPVVSWYLRLDGAPGAMPNWGIVRVEVPYAWFSRRDTEPDLAYVDQLCRTLCAYRCRDETYGRQPVSLHPIVRAEQSLGGLFSQTSLLANRFWRLLKL